MNLSHRLIFWSSLITILVCSFLLARKVFGESSDYRFMLKEYKQVYAEQLRHKITKFHKGDVVKIDLKNGKSVIGTFKSFVKYDDSVFITPVNASWFWKDAAYDVKELRDINLVYRDDPDDE